METKAEQESRAAEEAAHPQARMSDGAVATSLIGSHTLTHIYSQGFLVIIPKIYRDLGLVPLEAGLIETVRWLSSGAFSLLVGIITDMFQHRRGLFLALSLIIIGLGYLLVSFAPTYLLILLAIAFAATGNSIWHPPALGLLSQRFPRRRGLMMALHRSAGNVGDTLGPILVGFLLLGLTWRETLQWGFPVALGLALLVGLFLWSIGGPKPPPAPFRANFEAQMAGLKGALKSRGMGTLLAVAALRGMGDRALLLFLPLYLALELGMDSLQVGFLLALLIAPAIVTGPFIGSLSDRLGRKVVIIGVMLAGGIVPLLVAQAGPGVALMAVLLFGGIFMHSANSLVQAAALDAVEGQRLEGTFIGLLWGFNSLWSAVSPLLAGAIAGAFGFKAAFYYAAAMVLLGALLAIRLPSLKKTP